MCTDPTIFGYALVAIALLVLIILILVIDHSTPRPTRPVRQQQRAVDPLPQAAEQARQAAAGDRLSDLFDELFKGKHDDKTAAG